MDFFGRDLMSEAILKANPWIEGTENEKKIRVNVLNEKITDLHIINFLNSWDMKGMKIWENNFNMMDHFVEWRGEVDSWLPKLGLQNTVDFGWFWEECKRVWTAQHREVCQELEMTEQVERLKNLPQPAQRSAEWYSMRESMITASDWATCLGMDPYKTMKEFLDKKSGKEKPFLGNMTTEWGVKYEPVANAIYQHRMGEEIIEFGLIPHPVYSFIGASPDGITAKGRMVEIKCPPGRAITGVIPRYYWAQVQGQLEICDLERCDFLECKLEEFDETQVDVWNQIRYESNPYSKGLSNHWEYGVLPKSKTGAMEKGATLTFRIPNQEKVKYMYGPLNGTVEEMEEWKNQVIQENPSWELVYFSYWALLQVSCVPIYRDRQWFHEVALPRLATAWNGVRYWRTKTTHLEETGPFVKTVALQQTTIEPKKKVQNQYSLDDFA